MGGIRGGVGWGCRDLGGRGGRGGESEVAEVGRARKRRNTPLINSSATVLFLMIGWQ